MRDYRRVTTNVLDRGLIATAGAIVLIELMIEVATGHTPATVEAARPLNFRGIEIETIGVIWFAMMAALETMMRRATDDRRERLAVYAFIWLILALALALWIAVDSHFAIALPWQYWSALACLILLFVMAAVRPFSGLRALIRHGASDGYFVLRGWPVWLVTTGLAVLSWVAPTAADVARPGSIPTGADFLPWYIAQPRVPIGLDIRPNTVTIVTFLDYQCPSCRTFEELYRPLWIELRARLGDSLQLITMDFPLSRHCNDWVASKPAWDLHPLACDAAMAVRLSARADQAAAMREWLWSHQDTLTASSIEEERRRVVGSGPGFDNALGLDIRHQAAIGRDVGVSATPTYWLNGVVLPPVSAASFRHAILYEFSQMHLVEGPTN
jgi:protein-disulfide isomerase